MSENSSVNSWKRYPKVVVVGIGGGGTNAVNRMVGYGLDKVHFIAVNTDVQALDHSEAPIKLQIGARITDGLGAGANPELGEKSAQENEDDIRQLYEGADMVIVTAGMGGGTGTGAIPVFARIAQDMDILTVAIVTRPFLFEGKRRIEYADQGIAKLKNHVDAIVTIDNENLLTMEKKSAPMEESFGLVDEVLHQCVRGISELLYETGFVNVDFKDLQKVLKDSGKAYFGIGYAKGDQRAVEAAQNAVNNKMIDKDVLESAKSILINLRGSTKFSMEEAMKSVNEITSLAKNNGLDPEVIWGGGNFRSIKDDEVYITVIATGIPEDVKKPMPHVVAKKASPVTVREDEYSDNNEEGLDIPDFLRSQMG
ncbi:MAG: cell division protein FtsZ [Caldisericia bacterium]|nr:cell division protein FtsZ [Caldisericia bacterium]MDD4615043.1 cell division protein FtsZ [Caldisericia bacterium]